MSFFNFTFHLLAIYLSLIIIFLQAAIIIIIIIIIIIVITIIDIIIINNITVMLINITVTSIPVKSSREEFQARNPSGMAYPHLLLNITVCRRI